MTITVSGNTYNYRDILRNMGGTFTDEKVWKFPDTLGPAERTYLKKLIGCIVTDDAKAEPAEDFMARVAQKTERRGRTAIYGDDTTYFNHFAERDPLAFFGFSSVSALLDYIDAIPSAVRNDKRRNDAWITDAERRQFTKTNSMEHAFQLAKDGWKEGADKAAQISEIISAEHATVKKRLHSVAGGRVNIGRMLSGNPAHMKKRAPQEGRKVITLFVNIGMLAAIDAEKSIVRASCAAAVSDLLEQSGFSCEIVALQRSTNYVSPAFQMACIVKNAGERLNINDVVFMLGHPSVTRRLNFALKASAPELNCIWSGMGASKEMFTKLYRPKKNELYLEHLTPATQQLITGSTLEAKAKSTLKLIVGDDFPIEVKT